MKTIFIILILLMSVSTVFGTPINDPCIKWECTTTTETVINENITIKESIVYDLEYIEYTNHIWHESNKTHIRRSPVKKYRNPDGTCSVSLIREDYGVYDSHWSSNPNVTISTVNGVTTYEINDVDECNNIFRRRIDTSVNEGWWEYITVIEIRYVPRIVYDEVLEFYEYTYEVLKCVPIYICEPNPVPEPATMLLFGTGLIGLVGFRKKRK